MSERTPTRPRLLAPFWLALLAWTAAPVWAEPPRDSGPPPVDLGTPVPVSGPAGPVRIEVAFVLDTTGSMSGLIDGARRKIWSIANRLVGNQQRSGVRIALIGYRDRGDAYVTRRYDLTSDVDEIYGHLREFRAEGGGDGPESVNQALHEAVHDLSWSTADDVYRVVFLVGDAPPHTDYGDVDFEQTARSARRGDIFVNTIQCGSWDETARVWQRIAALGGGRYAAIEQDGGMQAVATPLDDELAQLNRELAGTVIAYGEDEQRREVASKVARSVGAEPETAADRLSYLSKAGAGIVSGVRDLVDAVRQGLELVDVVESELPARLRRMAPEERAAFIERNAAERARIKARVAELAGRRDAYLARERSRPDSGGRSEGFDAQVFDAIEAQAREKGITYDAH